MSKMETCPCCQKNTLHQFVQTALIAGRPDRHYVECHNRDCAMWMQTLVMTQFIEETTRKLAAK